MGGHGQKKTLQTNDSTLCRLDLFSYMARVALTVTVLLKDQIMGDVMRNCLGQAT